METQSITQEIVELQNRLEEIQVERSHLPGDAQAERQELRHEEQRVEERLAELRGLLAEQGPGDESHNPRDHVSDIATKPV